MLRLFFETGILARGIFRARPWDVGRFGIFYGQSAAGQAVLERVVLFRVRLDGQQPQVAEFQAEGLPGDAQH